MTDSTPSTNAEITALLESLRAGDAAASDRLLPLVYDVLHEIAARQLRSERPDHTLQPTILIHDAWLRLTADREAPWQNRSHFFALAARAMRRLLVDHARARRSGKRRGDLAEDLSEHLALPDGPDAVDLIALDDALEQLGQVDDRAREVVELRFFGGFEWVEIAAALGVSERTAKRDWRYARAWLRHAMDGPESTNRDPRSADSTLTG